MSKSATVTKKNAKAKVSKAKAAPAPKAKKSPLPSKVAYFILYVPDMKKAVTFYKSIGLNLMFDSPEWSEFDAGIKFALHATSACGTAQSCSEYTPVETNVSFGVDNAKAAYEAFKTLGVKLTSEPRQVCEDGGYCFSFEDCFGNELSCYGN